MSDYFELTRQEWEALHEVPVCGCGRPDIVLDLYRSVLRATPQAQSGGDWPSWEGRVDAADGDERLFYVVAYVLDHIEATEHGGSIGGTWRTEKGDLLLDVLDRYAEDYDRIPTYSDAA